MTSFDRPLDDYITVVAFVAFRRLVSLALSFICPDPGWLALVSYEIGVRQRHSDKDP